MGQSQSDGESEVQLGHIQRLYKKFVSECPSGNLHLHEFRKIFGVSAQSLTEESVYMDSIFHSFDTNEVWPFISVVDAFACACDVQVMVYLWDTN